MDDGVIANGFGEDEGEEAGADDSGGSAEAVDGSLELALLVFGGALAHEGLGGGPDDGHEVEEGDREEEQETGL